MRQTEECDGRFEKYSFYSSVKTDNCELGFFFFPQLNSKGC